MTSSDPAPFKSVTLGRRSPFQVGLFVLNVSPGPMQDRSALPIVRGMPQCATKLTHAGR